MKPSEQELANALGILCSCFSVPLSDKKHEIHLVVSVRMAEGAYLDALDILRRFHDYKVEDLYASEAS